MYFQRFIKVAPFAMLLAFNTQLGCGGPTAMDPGTPVGQSSGHLDLAATKAVSRDYLEVNLNIKTIEFQDPSTGIWMTAATPNRTINIMSQASVDALLAAQVKLAVGHYSKVRLTLGDGCSVKLLDGSVQALVLPVELQAGLVLDVDLNVKADVTIAAILDLDLSACIQLVVGAGSNTYYLRPLFRVIDKTRLGSITGVVKAKVSGAVLAGAMVTAEWFDDAGRPHIELAAMADVNGRFTLDRLTLGRKYHVVCRPQIGGIMYDGYASAELDLSVAASLNVELDLDVGIAATASASGNVTPRVGLEGLDRVELVEYLSCGAGCNKWFIVADVAAKVDTQENYYFSVLSQGRYGIQASRLHCLSGGLISVDPLWISADLNVNASVNLNLDISLKL